MTRLKKAWAALLGKEEAKLPKPSDPAPTPKWVIVMTVVGAVFLGVIGLLVLLAGYGLWKDDAPPRVADRPSEISWTAPSQEEATATEAAPTDGKETGKEEPQESKAEAAASEQITAKWATSPSPRNEALALALLGTGALLLLAGAFAPRITSIKLPGGGELAMTNLEGIAMALVGSQAQKDGKPQVAEDPRKLVEGARMLIERANVPVAQAAAVRTMGPVGVEAMLLGSPELEQQAKRVVEDLS